MLKGLYQKVASGAKLNVWSKATIFARHFCALLFKLQQNENWCLISLSKYWNPCNEMRRLKSPQITLPSGFYGVCFRLLYSAELIFIVIIFKSSHGSYYYIKNIFSVRSRTIMGRCYCHGYLLLMDYILQIKEASLLSAISNFGRR